MGKWLDLALDWPTRFKCRLGRHETVAWSLRTRIRYSWPKVWEGKCLHCFKEFRHEVEKPAMIPESERIQAPLPDPFRSDPYADEDLE